MYIFYFESVYSNGFWYWNLKVNRFDLWSILGSLALIPIHHTYYISWYRTLKTLCCRFNMTSRYEPLEFFQVIIYNMLLFFFLFMEIISARRMICKCGIRNAFHWIKTIKMRKKFMRLLPSFWNVSSCHIYQLYNQLQKHYYILTYLETPC